MADDYPGFSDAKPTELPNPEAGSACLFLNEEAHKAMAEAHANGKPEA